MKSTRVKINIKTGEIEFSGSEEFVSTQMENLNSVISLLSSKVITEKNGTIDQEEVVGGTEGEEAQAEGLVVPSIFGQWLQKFNDSINDLEKALVTAYYVQAQTSGNEFKTTEVNKSLKDHGIKLSNPSQSLKQLETKKYLFQTRKEGQKIKFMRVSQDGENHLKTLLT